MEGGVSREREEENDKTEEERREPRNQPPPPLTLPPPPNADHLPLFSYHQPHPQQPLPVGSHYRKLETLEYIFPSSTRCAWNCSS
ncbi:hypothetical protein HZH66_000847 [Vespula vulgaris]|uniref:Uncharacterized protein n=1 Tax=Vespula vulgaris TaxID=7454 RepID=A0A834KRY2_VESVU|nr:hypothetical protein HZH66_000847 [Vespula vulgaris]